jgi:hypothetical protein
MKHLKKFESFNTINEEEGLRKFFTGHDSAEAKEKAKQEFIAALDKAEEKVKTNPKEYVFNRASLEKKAKDNNYKGGLRIQQGGRDPRIYIVYDNGASGFEELASSASGEAHVRK